MSMAQKYFSCVKQGCLLAVCGLLLGIQSGSPSSVDHKERPSVNITGIITDTSGHEYPLDYITIAGRYNQIPVYSIPDNPDEDPANNTTKIDLDEVDEIHLDEPAVVQFKKRDYIKLRIIFKGPKRTTHTYIIERNRELRGEEPLGNAKSLDHEFKFLAIKKLKILGVKKDTGHFVDQKTGNPVAVNDLDITKTKMLIEEIEHATKQLPEHAGGAFEGLKSQLLYLISELKKTVWSWFA
jgi:hypothetical protein